MKDIELPDSTYNPEIDMLFNGHKMLKCDMKQWAHLGELLEDGDTIKIIAVRS